MVDFRGILRELDVVEKAVKENDDWADIRAKEFIDKDGRFKEQVPDNAPEAEPSQFGGCVNFMHELRGVSWENAEKVCNWTRTEFADIIPAETAEIESEE